MAGLFVFAACTASATASAPAAPTNPAVSAPLGTMASVSWTASANANSYNVYRGTTSGGETLVNSSLSGVSTITATFFEDTGLSSGQTYYYEITAVNGSGEGGKSSEVSTQTLPPAPATFTATAGDSQVVLKWTASPTATAYRIYRDTLGAISGGTTDFLVTGGTTITYTDTGLINGANYFYYLAPINANGENHSGGLFANEPGGNFTGTAVTPVATSSSEAPAGPPSGVTATAGNGVTILNWKPVSNATTYDVYRGTSTNSETSWKTGLTALDFTDTGLTNGTAYFYKVRADNAGQSSSLSTEVTATPYLPTAPGSLTAKAGSSLVALSWTATGTSYAIYRGTATGTETLLNSGLTGNTFTDAGVTNGTTYFYKVQALNPSGTGPLSSEVSGAPTGSTPQSWSANVNFNLPGEPVQGCTVSIPDITRPVQAAMLRPEGPNMQALATKYNAVVIGLDGFVGFNFGTPNNPVTLSTPNDSDGVCILDYRWPQLSALRIQAVLTATQAAIAQAFPANPHPEIPNTGIILDGFSEGTDNVDLAVSPSYNNQSGTIAPSPMGSRVLAVVQLSELDEDGANPVATTCTTPHLFLASGLSDSASTLNQGVGDVPSVTYDAYARGLATNQGGPLTVVNNAGVGHGGNADLPFISIWLDDILSQRLPATLPTSNAVSLPSWQNSYSWVGTYNISTSTSSPWGSSGNTGVQLTSNLVSAKTSYTDTRPFTWLPSQNSANTWLNFSNTGLMTAFNPVITSPTTVTGTPGSTFNYQITATNEPTSYNASPLPSGLTVNTSTGVISGTLAAGTTAITLTATNGEGSTTATLNLTVSTSTLTPQTISAFAAISPVTYGVSPFNITLPTASSGLAVTVTVQSGPATISGNTVTITGAGTVVLAANQLGNGTYSAAPQVTTSFTVNKASQTITFPTIATQTFGATPFLITPPTASSGLTVTVTVQSGPATINGNTVSLTGAGTVVLAANQAGNTNYSAAPLVTTSFTVNKDSQTITFPTISTQTFGAAPFLITPPTASSGQAVTVTVQSGPATISGNTVTLTGAGTIVLAANQSGNTNYNAAAQVTTSFTVNKASQTITFPTISTQTFGAAPFLITPPTASSGQAVTVTVQSGPATISGNTVTLTGAGTVVLAANQAGNTSYSAAPLVTTSFTVNKASQTITFPTISTQTFGATPFLITPPTAGSGLTVTVTVQSGPATISGNTVTLTGAGTVVLAANQAGNTNYNAAAQVTTSFTVNKSSQTITFPTIATQTFGAAPFLITPPTASSGLTVTVSVQSGPATISGNTVTLTGAGTVVLAANQSGNTNYNAAPQVTTSFTVNKASQTITFPTIATQTFGIAPFLLGAAASSGLGVSYSVLSGPASILGSTITLTGAGTVMVLASQAGNANYLAATSVTQSFTVNPSSITTQTFAQWETSYGISSPPSAEPESDGVTNLMKYLCDINPTVPMTIASRAWLPVVGSTTFGGVDYVTLTFRENARETGIAISVQTSQNLASWTPGSQPDLSEQVGVDPTTLDPIMELGVKVTGAVQQFIRLNVTMP